MDGKLILNQQIIDKVIAKSGTGPKGFTYPKLIDDLIGFVAEHKELIGKDLYKEFSKSGLSDDKKLRLALSQDKIGSGAMPGLRDLLCFYAYGKNYESVIIHELGLTLQQEIDFDKQFSSRQKKDGNQFLENKIHEGFDSLRERLSNVDNNLGNKLELLTELVERNQQINQENAEYTKASTIYFESIENKDREKRRESLEVMIRFLNENIDEKVRLLGFFAGELIAEKIHIQEYEEAAELGERVSKLCPDNMVINFFTGHALHACRKYDEALICFNRNLKIYPHEGENVFFKIITLYELKEYKTMLDLTEESLQLYREGKMYRVLSRMSFASFKMKDIVVQADELVLRNLLRIRIMALTCNKAADGMVLNAMNDFLEIEDDLDLMKSKLSFLRNRHDEFLKYCESCSRKFPKEPYFLMQLIAAQIQLKIKTNKILKNVIKVVAIRDTEANYQLKTDSVYKPLWEHPYFERIINGDPPMMWRFW